MKISRLAILPIAFCFSTVLASSPAPTTGSAPVTVLAPSSSPANSPIGSDQKDFHISLDTPIRVDGVTKTPENPINWPTVITSLLAAVLGAGGAYFVAKRTLTQNSNAAELKDLQAKLDAFYGPYLQRSEENKLLADEVKSRQDNPNDFRTLTLLLDPDWRSRLTISDQTIVGEIVRNDRDLNSLIREKAGMVDEQVLVYLVRASAHFRMMDLAYRKKLENRPDRFGNYIYPRQLDGVLKLEMDRLRQRCDLLRRKPMLSHRAIEPLKIPPNLALPSWPRTGP
jgi:hypothetical protein